MPFRRRLFGYDRAEVDHYVVQQEDAHRACAEHEAMVGVLRAEVENLRAAEPMLKVSAEISALLTSFAVTVATMREQAEREATMTRRAADAYAEGLRSEADRVLTEARERATALADDIIRQAREEVMMLTREQATVEAALDQAAHGITTWMDTFDRLKDQVAEPTNDAIRLDAPEGQDASWEAEDSAAAEPGHEDEIVLPDTALGAQRAGEPPLEPIQVDPAHGVIVNFAPPPDGPGPPG